MEDREKIRRVNIDLQDEEEVKLYQDMKSRAAKQGVSLHDFVIELFRKESRKQ